MVGERSQQMYLRESMLPNSSLFHPLALLVASSGSLSLVFLLLFSLPLLPCVFSTFTFLPFPPKHLSNTHPSLWFFIYCFTMDHGNIASSLIYMGIFDPKFPFCKNDSHFFKTRKITSYFFIFSKSILRQICFRVVLRLNTFYKII